MGMEKNILTGSTAMLLLKLLDGADLYGYQMIEELRCRSDSTFELKAGTLYPLLHGLEEKGLVRSYERNADAERLRKYYHLTEKGRRTLAEKRSEWNAYSAAVNRVLEGGACLA